MKIEVLNLALQLSKVILIPFRTPLIRFEYFNSSLGCL